MLKKFAMFALVMFAAATVYAAPDQDVYKTYYTSVPASDPGLGRLSSPRENPQATSAAPSYTSPYTGKAHAMESPHFLHSVKVTSPAATGTIQFFDAFLTSTTAYGAAATTYTTNVVLTSTMAITNVIDISSAAGNFDWTFDSETSSGITYIKTGTSGISIHWK